MASALAHEAREPRAWSADPGAVESGEADMRFATEIHGLARAYSVRELFATFERSMELRGFDWVLFVMLTRPRALPPSPRQGVLNTFPREWVSHYLWRGYDQIDPVRSAARTQIAPFTWASLRDRAQLTRVQRRLLDEAQAAGLHSGVGVPVHGPGGASAVICLASAGDRPEPTANALVRLHCLATQLYARYWHLNQPAVMNSHPATLSAKELEVLRWLATGLSQSEVAEKLHVSTHGVDFHVRKILSKLEAKNITAAVYFAASRGLIDPG